MQGHVRTGFSAFCLLFALPVALPLLLPAIREISLTAVSPASYGAVWLSLGLGAVLLLTITSLAVAIVSRRDHASVARLT